MLVSYGGKSSQLPGGPRSVWVRRGPVTHYRVDAVTTRNKANEHLALCQCVGTFVCILLTWLLVWRHILLKSDYIIREWAEQCMRIKLAWVFSYILCGQDWQNWLTAQIRARLPHQRAIFTAQKASPQTSPPCLPGLCVAMWNGIQSVKDQ